MKKPLLAVSMLAVIIVFLVYSSASRPMEEEFPGNLSKGTPSVPQGPAITLQEEHNLRDANKFDRAMEHMFAPYMLNDKNRKKEMVLFRELQDELKSTLTDISVKKTDNYLTDIEISVELTNLGKNSIYIYDLIFNRFIVPSVEPKKRILIDKTTDNFQLKPGASINIEKRLELPWFQREEPEKLNRPENVIVLEIVASKERINVDEFFIETKKAHNVEELPGHLKVLYLVPKNLSLKR